MNASLHDISAAILAGGMGTRLRSVVSDRPKVLAPVAGRPFLAHLLDQLADAGLRDVTLLTGFAAEMIPAAFGDSFREMRLRYSPEPEPLGTGGALRNAMQFLAGDKILLLNGDSYCDVNLTALVEQHSRSQASATLSLAEVPDGSRFGRVQRAVDNRIERFEEKGGTAEPGWINAGVYLIQREVVEAIPPGRAVSLERDVFPEWVARGRVFGFPAGRFIDIGTPESFAEADAFFA